MAHTALYRKWRPLTFEDVVEQQHIVATLKNSIKRHSISHAYLFCGTRGTGKTTLARIFGRAINCLTPNEGSPCNQCSVCKALMEGAVTDVIEIDAASNNGVDDVREIKEAVMYVPVLAKYKVYIIDEVHMLSTGAFNALLKTLEEPPANVVFILATTEPHKLPATVLSRCQRYDFRRFSGEGIVSRLKIIADDCRAHFEDSALKLIARLSEGGMRDAINLLDQCISMGLTEITREDVLKIAGLTSSETVDALALALVAGDSLAAVMLIDKAMDEGRDLVPLCGQLIEWFRDLMLYLTGGEARRLLTRDEEGLGPLKEGANYLNYDQTVYLLKELSEAEGRLKWSESPRIFMEMTMVRLCTAKSSAAYNDIVRIENKNTGENVEALLEARIARLEKALAEALSGQSSKKIENASHSKSEKAQEIKETVVNAASEKVKAEVQKAEQKEPYLGQDLKEWPQVVEDIRNSGKMKIYAYLLDTRCVLRGENQALVVVGAEDGLKKTVLARNDSIEAIQGSLHTVTGRDFKVKIADLSALTDEVSKEEPTDPVLDNLKKFATENNIKLDVYT